MGAMCPEDPVRTIERIGDTDCNRLLADPEMTRRPCAIVSYEFPNFLLNNPNREHLLEKLE